ncbi:hypothetical protein ATQ64_25125, partial [Salmonella enterica]|nr:hypothetical protein [Salmonella enterica]
MTSSVEMETRCKCTPSETERGKDGERREARPGSFPAGGSLQGFSRGLTGGLTRLPSCLPAFSSLQD